jgi:hypothetical protein
VGIGRWTKVVDAYDAIVLAQDSARRAGRGAQDAIAGVGGLRDVGERGRHSAYHARASRGAATTRTGGEFYHDDDDRLTVLARIDADFDRFRAEVEPTLVAPGVSEARSQWWTIDVLPALKEWKEFLARESSWLARFATEWSTYVQWLTRLRAMRSDARMQGIALHGPEPLEIPRTMFERGATGLGDRADTVWTTGRVILYAALGITGVLALRGAWKDLREFRQQEDPQP